ncbi:hypothetical protein CSPX01_05427 [Colletotrichum filicis]|nr:hypothetical protein CSPX01_05427 [Colletotrichum filicis]
MPRQERHHKERVVYDDDPYYDDYERPRASRRVSRSAHEYEASSGHRRSTRRHDSYSPVGPARARSESYGRPPARRHDTYAEYSDSGDDRPRRRGHGQSSSSRRKDSKTSRSSRGPERNDSDKAAIIQAAATAAVVAGASEAWRMRKEKTSWSQKGTRMATAAAGAAAIAAFNNNTNGQHGSKDGGGSKKDTIQATLGGLLVNRLANGVGKK